MTNTVFKTVDGDRINLIEHCISVLKRHPMSKIYVGCDSQNKRRATLYATVVAFRYGFRGVHIVYHFEKLKKNKDRYTRLWREVERSVEVARFLRDNGFNIEAIDLDFNSDEKAGSNFITNAASGYCTGFGFSSNVKPDGQVATKAADHLVR